MVCTSITHPGSRSDEETTLSVLICHLEEVVLGQEKKLVPKNLEEVVAVVLVAVCSSAPPVVVEQQRDGGSVGSVEMQWYVESVVACDLNIGENHLSSLADIYYLTHHRIHKLYLFVMGPTWTNIHVTEERISVDGFEALST